MASGAAFFEQREGAASKPLPAGFARREPEKTLLYQLVREHLETFLAQVNAEDPNGFGLPAYVTHEFRRYLDCGIAARGFVRLVCCRCHEEMIVAFSCKGLGFCPSCLGRRMNVEYGRPAKRLLTRNDRSVVHDVAAHLVDRVLPFSPYRHYPEFTIMRSWRTAASEPTESCSA